VVAITVLSFHTLYLYISGGGSSFRIPNFAQMVAEIKTEKPTALYGTHEVAPLLAYEAKIPLLNAWPVENESDYRPGVISKTELLQKAARGEVVIVSYGTGNPQAGVKQAEYGGILYAADFANMCQVIKTFPAIWKDGINRINFSKCHLDSGPANQ
jgi:hypothetical protein